MVEFLRLSMADERKPTRLDLHRAKFHQQKKMIPLLLVSDLSEEECDIIASEVFKLKKISDEENIQNLYFYILSDFGVMCPHPQEERRYEGTRQKQINEIGNWYKCLLCHCLVLNGKT